MATYYMPDDFADIATFIAAAVSGADKLIVRDGTWTGANNRGLSPGKNVVIESENGWVNCILDAENLDRHFVFSAGESTAFVVDGFQIINGNPGGTSFGGSIVVTNGAPKFQNIVFFDNSTNGNHGGCIFCSGGSADPSFWNCLFFNNVAGGGGKGGCCYAYNAGCNPGFASCTITANSAPGGNGGGLAGDSWGGAYIYNTILWGNTAGTSAPNFYLGSSPVGRAYNSCYDLVGMIGNFISNTACVFTDPLLVAGGLGNYYLSHIAAGQGADSPCIDAGNPAYALADWNTLTTRTDDALDVAPVDIGFHWPLSGSGVANTMMMQMVP